MLFFQTPSNLRLNRAKWVPHGPTSFPTLMPDGKNNAQVFALIYKFISCD